MPSIFVDADACPVKDEIYRVARRVGFDVVVVANSFIRTPAEPRIRFQQVDAGPDIADKWIADRAVAGDIVVTNDIPLAAACLPNNAEVLAASGKVFTTDSIGAALATRSVMDHLRSIGEGGGGPPPFGQRERSNFLNALDQAVNRARRKGVGTST
jgi:uncharacterized protein YaiI (UPF0178 family)